MYVNICSKLYETIYYLSVWECVTFSMCVCVCVCSPHVSECGSEVPHSFIMSSKYEERKNETKDRRHQQQEVLRNDPVC